MSLQNPSRRSLSLIVLFGLLTACHPRKTAEEENPLREKHRRQLQAFAALKEQHAEKLTQLNDEKIVPIFRELFNAAKNGQSQAVIKMWADFRRRHPQYQAGNSDLPSTPYWSTVLEVCMAYESFSLAEPEHLEMAVNDLMRSIKPGSIYFGGSDVGRALPTAFSTNHPAGIPFFTLTQNALADGLPYLQYLRATFGDPGLLYIPTDHDWAQAFSDYNRDAQARLFAGLLKPNENVTAINGKINIQGQVALMEVNALLVKVIFEENPQREFFIEQSYAIDWMYPRLCPIGVVLRVNRNPLETISTEAIAQDTAYWSDRVSRFLGDWLNETTTPAELARFVEIVHRRKDFTDFHGDRKFIQSKWGQWAYSRWRTGIGDVYAWRANHTKDPLEKARLSKAAEFAFKQAVALGPTHLAAIQQYTQSLLDLGRAPDAFLIADAARKLQPNDSYLKDLVQKIQKP